jgi:hypothetical protein
MLIPLGTSISISVVHPANTLPYFSLNGSAEGAVVT